MSLIELTLVIFFGFLGSGQTKRNLVYELRNVGVPEHRIETAILLALVLWGIIIVSIGIAIAYLTERMF